MLGKCVSIWNCIYTFQEHVLRPVKKLRPKFNENIYKFIWQCLEDGNLLSIFFF